VALVIALAVGIGLLVTSATFALSVAARATRNDRLEIASARLGPDAEQVIGRQTGART
jgi:hypothetical protein